ncbi:hypothetical protein DL764_000564 [Monosporascus ibericus]|uniref:Uncharacterized protein n=1 Tax=Monosporascus ibericus TaxID=155417 RepID=A0A4Q4TVJ0_9PEZI|nr:hypothetical protein DL764_000564 [Monosporascus ibericus]
MTDKISSDESQPLMTPGLIQPPPAERAQDGESGDERKIDTEIHITPVMVVRLILIILAITSVVHQLLGEPRLFASIVLVILTFIIIFWNIIALTPFDIFQLCSRKGKAKSGNPPSSGLIVGEEDTGRTSTIGPTTVDRVLTVLVVLFTIGILTDRSRCYRWRVLQKGIARSQYGVMALAISLCFIHLVCWRLIIRVKLSVLSRFARDRDDYQYRIRLPQDSAAASGGLSIAA